MNFTCKPLRYIFLLLNFYVRISIETENDDSESTLNLSKKLKYHVRVKHGTTFFDIIDSNENDSSVLERSSEASSSLENSEHDSDSDEKNRFSFEKENESDSSSLEERLRKEKRDFKRFISQPNMHSNKGNRSRTISKKLPGEEKRDSYEIEVNEENQYLLNPILSLLEEKECVDAKTDSSTQKESEHTCEIENNEENKHFLDPILSLFESDESDLNGEMKVECSPITDQDSMFLKSDDELQFRYQQFTYDFFDKQCNPYKSIWRRRESFNNQCEIDANGFKAYPESRETHNTLSIMAVCLEPQQKNDKIVQELDGQEFRHGEFSEGYVLHMDKPFSANTHEYQRDLEVHNIFDRSEDCRVDSVTDVCSDRQSRSETPKIGVSTTTNRLKELKNIIKLSKNKNTKKKKLKKKLKLKKLTGRQTPTIDINSKSNDSEKNQVEVEDLQTSIYSSKDNQEGKNLVDRKPDEVYEGLNQMHMMDTTFTRMSNETFFPERDLGAQMNDVTYCASSETSSKDTDSEVHQLKEEDSQLPTSNAKLSEEALTTDESKKAKEKKNVVVQDFSTLHVNWPSTPLTERQIFLQKREKENRKKKRAKEQEKKAKRRLIPKKDKNK